MARAEYDYVIIGGGSAGCTLAVRLSEDPSVSVLLVEAGHSRGNWLDYWKIEMPAAFGEAWRNAKFNWMYEGEPEPQLGGRSVFQPRGKVLGGSSAINGMCFIRGHALDYERWVTEGAAGWSWREVLPYFKRLETWQEGESTYRGGSGPVHVRRGDLPSPLYHAFLEAGQQAAAVECLRAHPVDHPADGGERPLLSLVEHLQGQRSRHDVPGIRAQKRPQPGQTLNRALGIGRRHLEFRQKAPTSWLTRCWGG